MKSFRDLPGKVLEAAEKTGIDVSEEKRSASFFHLDESMLFTKLSKEYRNSMEILDIKEALNKYSSLKEYFWKIVEKNSDEYTRNVDEKLMGGYFIRIFPGQKIRIPLQACMFISKQGLSQYIHNVIIAEEGCEAQIITGCAVEEAVKSSEHVGVSEFYVGKNAKLTFTMIHNWNKTIKVRPRSAAVLGENASFISNYVILNPVKDLQSYPTAYCRGRNSVARFSSLIYAAEDSSIDTGNRIILEAENSRGEIISRAIARDHSKVISRGEIRNMNPHVRGHLECRGLLLGRDAVIHAVPELSAKGEGSEMSHEAAVGKIAEKEILYLMSRGLSKEDASALIIRGFLDTSILHLPPELEKTIKEMTANVSEKL